MGMHRIVTLLGALALASAVRAQSPGEPPRGPPPEALQACASLEVGAACSFSHDGREVSGTCVAGPHGEAAACLPPRPPHGFGPPPEAIAACSGLAAGAACTVAHDGTSMEGTCRSGPPGSPVACAPSGPPPERP